jgi:Kef-type K+ transport system membrane component KefB
MRPSLRRLVLFALFVGAAAPAWATADGAHHDPVAPVVGGLALILLAAKAGGEIALRFRQPAVLGELLAGVVLGNLHHLGTTALDPLKGDPSLDMLARLGVLILLFEVGLESTVVQMLEVGTASFAVAVLGVVAPFALGWAVGIWLLPDHSVYVHAFLGATLCATSVGITARVLQDLKRSQTREARIILGAAVIDDVLGLIVLAVVSAVILAANAGHAVSYGEIALVVLKAAVFLAGSLWLGVQFSPRAFALASRLQGRGVLLAAGLGFCFLLSWAADAIGLAPIVGAFAAGLILEDVHYRDFVARGEHGLEELIRPIGAFLIPIFFVLMGARTDVSVFARTDVLALAAALIAAAVIGKQACSLGVIGPGLDRLSVGIGMIPRGEVGLIFAGMGATLAVGGEKIIDEATFSAVVVMVIVTTMITPPALKWSLHRHSPNDNQPDPTQETR